MNPSVSVLQMQALYTVLFEGSVVTRCLLLTMIRDSLTTSITKSIYLESECKGHLIYLYLFMFGSVLSVFNIYFLGYMLTHPASSIFKFSVYS